MEGERERRRDKNNNIINIIITIINITNNHNNINDDNKFTWKPCVNTLAVLGRWCCSWPGVRRCANPRRLPTAAPSRGLCRTLAEAPAALPAGWASLVEARARSERARSEAGGGGGGGVGSGEERARAGVSLIDRARNTEHSCGGAPKVVECERVQVERVEGDVAVPAGLR